MTEPQNVESEGRDNPPQKQNVPTLTSPSLQPSPTSDSGAPKLLARDRVDDAGEFLSPERLRQKQLEQKKRRFEAPWISIHGKTGRGKSTVSMNQKDRLQELAIEHYGRPVRVYANFQIYLADPKTGLRKIDEHGNWVRDPSVVVWSRIEDLIDPDCQFPTKPCKCIKDCIVIFDEPEAAGWDAYHFNNARNEVYNSFARNFRKHCVIPIFISQSVVLPRRTKRNVDEFWYPQGLERTFDQIECEIWLTPDDGGDIKMDRFLKPHGDQQIIVPRASYYQAMFDTEQVMSSQSIFPIQIDKAFEIICEWAKKEGIDFASLEPKHLPNYVELWSRSEIRDRTFTARDRKALVALIHLRFHSKKA